MGAAVCEGHALAERLGLDQKTLAEILNTSSGRCWSSDTYNPCPGVMEGVPAARDYSGGFACDLMIKDLGLAAGFPYELTRCRSQGLLGPIRIHRQAKSVSSTVAFAHTHCTADMDRQA